MLAQFWLYMLCKTAPLTCASRAKPDKMAPVWTIRIFLGRKRRKSYRQACHTVPASSATSVSTGMWQRAIKWSWHSTKQFMKSCLSTTFLCLRSERFWLIKAHAIPQAVTGFSLHLYILNCTDCAPGELLPQKGIIAALWAMLKRRWCKHPRLSRASRKQSVLSFLVPCQQNCSLDAWLAWKNIFMRMPLPKTKKA